MVETDHVWWSIYLAHFKVSWLKKNHIYFCGICTYNVYKKKNLKPIQNEDCDGQKQMHHQNCICGGKLPENQCYSGCKLLKFYHKFPTQHPKPKYKPKTLQLVTRMHIVVSSSLSLLLYRPASVILDGAYHCLNK